MARKQKQTQSPKRDQYDDTNRGVLFVNDKEGNEKRPDFTGQLTINVEDFELDENGSLVLRLAAWQRESERVGEYLSIAVSQRSSS